MTQPKTTLYRSLCHLINDYPLPDLVETLALIAHENKFLKTSELLDTAVDTAISERSDSALGNSELFEGGVSAS